MHFLIPHPAVIFYSFQLLQEANTPFSFKFLPQVHLFFSSVCCLYSILLSRPNEYFHSDLTWQSPCRSRCQNYSAREQLTIKVVPTCIFRFCDSIKIPHVAVLSRIPLLKWIISRSRHCIFIPYLIFVIPHPASYLSLIPHPTKPILIDMYMYDMYVFEEVKKKHSLKCEKCIELR